MWDTLYKTAANKVFNNYSRIWLDLNKKVCHRRSVKGLLGTIGNQGYPLLIGSACQLVPFVIRPPHLYCVVVEAVK